MLYNLNGRGGGAGILIGLHRGAAGERLISKSHANEVSEASFRVITAVVGGRDLSTRTLTTTRAHAGVHVSSCKVHAQIAQRWKVGL